MFDAQDKIGKMERHLEQEPSDHSIREKLLMAYGQMETVQFEPIRRHTLVLAVHRQNSSEIVWANTIAFAMDDDYRREVMSILVRGLDESDDAARHWVFAEVEANLADLPVFDHDSQREFWRRYMGLSQEVLATLRRDEERLRRSSRHFERAFRLASGTEMEWFYAERFVEVLMGAQEIERAIAVFDELFSRADRPALPDLQISMADCQRRAGRLDKAMEHLEAAIAEDRYGCERGGHVTNRAATKLGCLLIETRRDYELAKVQLHRSIDVIPCCHLTSQGVAMELAVELWKAGCDEDVARYCRRVLEFAPSNEPILKLLAAVVSR